MKLRQALLGAVGAVAIAALAANAQVPGGNSTLNSIFTLAYEASTSKPTYSASNVVAVTSTAAVNDICSLQGSATKTLRVRRIIVGGNATAVESNFVGIIKRSSSGYTGAGTQPTIIPYNSSDAAATGIVETWAAAATATGTALGTLIDQIVGFPNATTGINAPPTVFEFGRLAAPLFLRGTAQFVAVNLGGINFTSGNLACTFEWTEDNDS